MNPRASGPAGFIVVLALVAALSGLAALDGLTLPGDPALWPPEAEGPEVVVLDNGFHTDMAIRRADLAAGGGPLALALDQTPAGDWVLVGWGDARFYVDQSPMAGRLPDGARAFFRPGNASVVMLDPIDEPPAGEGRRVLRLSPAGFAGLRARLQDALALEDGRPRLAAARPGDDARFFAGTETFWIGHLCNHWTSGLLSAAGLPTRPWRAVTSGGVMADIDRAELDRRAAGA